MARERNPFRCAGASSTARWPEGSLDPTRAAGRDRSPFGSERSGGRIWRASSTGSESVLASRGVELTETALPC